jgi:hypothetical protein
MGVSHSVIVAVGGLAGWSSNPNSLAQRNQTTAKGAARRTKKKKKKKKKVKAGRHNATPQLQRRREKNDCKLQAASRHDAEMQQSKGGKKYHRGR